MSKRAADANPWRTPLVAILCSLAMAVPGTAARGAEPAAPKANAGAAPARPNIILVLTDDLDVKLGTLDMLPGFKALFRDQGVTFANSFVSESLCCPSRATIQRGQWVHNHQVLGNKAPEGGFEKFHSLKEDQSTVGTWLHAAGYRTGFVGKYLNGYPDTADPTFVPPGWDEWDSPAKGNAYGEYNYTLNENGSLVGYGNQPEDYLTDVLSRKATRFVKQAGDGRQPFFLVVATYAPHQPATPAPRHADAFGGVSAPRPSSYNEEDVSDKPAWIQAKPLLNRRQQLQMDNLYRKRLQSMLAVKELVEELLKTLRESGQLDNSYVFFASDNGFHLGEHRLHAGKLTAYEEDIRVPLYVRGPGVPAGSGARARWSATSTWRRRSRSWRTRPCPTSSTAARWSRCCTAARGPTRGAGPSWSSRRRCTSAAARPSARGRSSSPSTCRRRRWRTRRRTRARAASPPTTRCARRPTPTSRTRPASTSSTTCTPTRTS